MNYVKFFFKNVWRKIKDRFKKPSDFSNSDRVLGIKDEEILAQTIIENAKIKANHVVVSEPVKEVKKKRRFCYKLQTKDGETLYEGRKLLNFMKKNDLEKEFSFRSAYRFAKNYGDTKIFKKKYLISSKEV